ncbi:isopentenyl-diphosphate Delta-isomerase [Celerinatantimonas yamalensis]|uniref:Isopentenyl-diphosphate Delta-isomerase n=1 Tax=Celerinatantimonas yamalensis TaxID=559956 RepID=A0ABW9GB20_9GAMM
MAIEYVVLLDKHRRAYAQMDKRAVHHQQTPFHLGFSCYIFNAKRQLLVTRRALSKQTWPGVWSNSVCGHPAPNEPFSQAVMRRARHELGLNIRAPQLLIDDYRYWAKDASGVIEYEYCPIYWAQAQSDLALNSEEVMDYQWINGDKLVQSIQATPWAFSPWMVEQVELLCQRKLWPH